MNIYDIKGPDFLLLFIAAETGAVLLATLARKIILCYNTVENSKEQPEIDCYDAAYLNGGSKHMFMTALASLEHQNKISLKLEEKKVALISAVENSAHTVERIVAGAIWAKDSSIKEVFDAVNPTLEKLELRLQSAGLIPDKSQDAMARIIPFQLTFFPVICLAIPKCIIGLERGKPIGFLGLLMAFSTVLAIMFFMKKPLRTQKGDELLSMLKRNGAALQVNYKSFAQNMKTSDLTLAYALFAAFTFNLLNPQKQALASSSGNHIWSYSPASCGASSCGGGSCGGGGGCGGCGGCGG